MSETLFFLFSRPTSSSTFNVLFLISSLNRAGKTDTSTNGDQDKFKLMIETQTTVVINTFESVDESFVTFALPQRVGVQNFKHVSLKWCMLVNLVSASSLNLSKTCNMLCPAF